MRSTLIAASGFLCVALLACSAVGTDTDTTTNETPPSPFPLGQGHVVFYNVENLFDTENDPRTDDEDFTATSKMEWTEDRLATKLTHLAEAIDMAGHGLPALVGLAEVENKAVVERLVNERILRKGKYSVIHFDSPDERGIDVALLVSKQFKVERSEALKVDLEQGDRTRDILHAELTAKGHTFHVFVNHWPSRSGGVQKSELKRMAAAKALRRAVHSVEPSPTVHMIIMGDLNDAPMDRSIQEGLGACCDTDSKELVDLMCLNSKEGSGSYNYRGQWDFLDQFIVNKALVDHVQRAGAVSDDRLLFKHPKYGPTPDKTYSSGGYKGGYSDHLPIVLQFK